MINGFGSIYSPPLEESEDIFRRVTQGSIANYIPPTNDDVSFMETLDASLGYTYMPILNAIQNSIKYHNEVDPNYQPFIHLEGYEEFYEQLSEAKNADHMADLKRQIDENKKRRQILYDSSIGSQIIAGIFDPINLISLPFGGFALGAARAAGRVGSITAGLQVGQEALRLPFDPLGTTDESLANIGMAFVGGAVLGGAVGAVVGRKSNALKQMQQDELDMINITEQSKTKLQDIKDKQSTIDPKYKDTTDAELLGLEKEIPLNSFGLEESIKNLKSQGVDLLPEVKRLEEDLVELNKIKEQPLTNKAKAELQKEISLLEQNIKNKRLLENQIQSLEQNKVIAKEVEQELSTRRTNEENIKSGNIDDPLALEKNWFTDNIIYKALSTPYKRLLQSANPTSVKAVGYDIGGDSGQASVLHKYGQSRGPTVYQLSKIREGEWVQVHDELRKIYGEFSGKTLRPLDIDISDTISRVTKQQTYGDWLSTTYTKILKGTEELTDIEKRVKSQIDGFMTRWEERLREQGIIGDSVTIKKQFDKTRLRIIKDTRILDDLAKKNKQNEARLTKIKEELEAQYRGESENIGLSDKQIEFLESINEMVKQKNFLFKAQRFYRQSVINRLKRNNQRLKELDENLRIAKETPVLPQNEEFFFPRYWSKEKIKANRNVFKQILVNWFTDNPTVLTRKADGTFEQTKALTAEEIQRATSPKKVEARAEETIKNILGERMALTEDSMAYYGYGKSKHFRHRTLDIPNKLVADFIETNPVQVMRVYTLRVAPKYEFAKKFNGRTIDEVLDDVDDDMINAGKSEKEINRARRDILHLHDRVVGTVLQATDDVTRLSNRIANGVRYAAETSYLGSSGFSAIPDFAKVMMEHELKNVAKGLFGLLNDSKVRLSVKEGRLAGEILEILQGDTHLRFLEDLSNNPFESGFINKSRSLFYILNGLAPFTNIMKKLDVTIRQHSMIEYMIKEVGGTASAKDIQYLRRYNISRQMSEEIVNSKAFDKTDNGLYLANTEKWLESGISADTLDAFRTSLNSGIMNTILMGTPADKPIITDGVVYIPSRIGKMFGLAEDSRYRGYSRIENGLMGLPFQFWSYSFAAANKITAGMFTGSLRNRTVGTLAALGLGYMSLQIKGSLTSYNYFEQLPLEDQLARSFDASGLAAVYTDLFYTAMSTSLALGGPDLTQGILQPKYPQEENTFDAVTGIGGAGFGIVQDYYEGVDELVNGETGQGLSKLLKALPYMKLWFLKDTVNEIGYYLNDTDFDFDKVNRSRF